jgi:hypothetical protein
VGTCRLKIISHRGYVDGPDPNIENNPMHIERLIKNSIDVEVDVWFLNDRFCLGHDKPRYGVSPEFLTSSRLWCHAKNISALEKMLEIGAHCFWHEEDQYTLTSKGYIWAYPGCITPKTNSVFLFPERYPEIDTTDFAFICTDYIYNKGEQHGN